MKFIMNNAIKIKQNAMNFISQPSTGLTNNKAIAIMTKLGMTKDHLDITIMIHPLYF